MQRKQVLDAILWSLDVNVAIVDKDGFIVQVNDRWEKFAQENGADPKSVGVGVNYLDICRRTQASCPEMREVLEGILAVMNGSVSQFQREYRCDSPTEERWFVLKVSPMPDGLSGAIITHQNDTDSRKSELHYGHILEAARAVIWRGEAPTFRTTFVSKHSADLLGYAPEEWIKQPTLWIERMHPDDRDWVLEYSSKAVQEKQDHSFEYRMTTADGRTIWLRNIVKVIVLNGEPKELVGISVDINDLKQAQELVHDLAGQLLNAQEEERSAIARELHDDIGQSLALLKMRLGGLKQLVMMHPDERRQIEAIAAHADKIARDVQSLSRGLHPSALELLGLQPAVEQLCREFGEHAALTVNFRFGTLPTLPNPVSSAIYRIVQECLRNASKHSNASQVSVTLTADPGQLRLEVVDDGSGFDPLAKDSLGGLGLSSMRQRLRLLDGRFSISSAPGKGTRVEATVPLPSGL